MPFLPPSRYAGLPTVEVSRPGLPAVTAVKLRRLPATTGEAFAVRQQERLDVLARDRLGNSSMFWRIADANTELEASALVAVPGRIIAAPEP